MTIPPEEFILNPDAASQIIMSARKKYLDMPHSEIRQLCGKDTRWSCSVPDKSKKDGHRKIRGATREEVENAVIQFYMAQEKPSIVSSLTVGDCWQRWYDFRKEHNKSLSPSSFQIYRQCWRRYFEGTAFAARKIAEVTDLDIETFLIETIEQRNLNRKCAQELVFHVRNLFKRAYKDRVIDRNPWDYVDLCDTVYPACVESEVKHDREMVLSPEQAEALTKAVEDHLANNPDYLPDLGILVCKYTGMRPGEVVALQWNDVRVGYISLEHSEHRWSADGGGKQTIEVGDPKCHKERLVPVCRKLKDVFDRIREVQTRNGWDSEWVFYWKNGHGVKGRMIANTLQKAMFRRGKEAGLEGNATAYRFRRTMESGLRMHGKSGEAVGHMLGHSKRVGDEHYAYDMETLPEMQEAVSAVYGKAG